MSEQQFEQTGWTLDTLLTAPKGPELDQILEELEQHVAQLEAGREDLSPDIETERFMELMRLYDSIESTVRRLTYYGFLWFAEDTQSQGALSFMGRMEQLSTEIKNRLLFFSLWWKGLDEKPAQRLMAESGDYAYYLKSLRLFKPYTLSEAEEKVINLKDVNGPKALVKLYQIITGQFSFQLEVEGETREMTRGELTTYCRNPSPELRAAAYQELFRVYGEQENPLAQIYNHIARDWANENLTLRGFASPISVRNLSNDIPDPVVETLLEVCRRNMPIFHRYFRLKADWTGMEKLRRYDVYAPIQATDEKTYPYPEAANMVLESLHQFSPTLADHARRVFAENHIDAEIRKRKRSGAFCASALPGMAPWVLVNFNQQVDDVLTLAHEIGHAIHAMMAQDHSVFTFHSTLPLAETASVFSEMLLVDGWLEEEPDPTLRRDILATILDDAYATIARQAYFVLFEREAHPQAVQGATSDELCATYMENLQEQFGDAVEISDDFRWEWIAIPHFYRTPFYCYAYSFGHLLVLALYQQYKNEGESFIPRYLRILAYGGSASPTHITQEAGFDISSPDFWQGGFDVLEGMLDELETL